MSRGKIEPPSFDKVRRKLEELGFTLAELPEQRLLARKYSCAAVLARLRGGDCELHLAPGRVVRGEWSRLIDRGYQKFFKTAETEVPALPEEMSALANFQKELYYALGIPVLYNQSLGSVSDRYLYDRVWYRDEGRQPKPWEAAASEAMQQPESTPADLAV